jgi:hypothetical protein
MKKTKKMSCSTLQLILKLDLNEKLQFINSLTKFFNLNEENSESLVKKFDFINFSNKLDKNCPQVQNSKSNIPSYSIILFTVDQAYTVKEENELDVDVDLKYHHKVELKDEREKVVARQVFYELNKNLPLLCKTNWLPSNSPLTASSPKRNCNIKIESKYILRLNINCKNYDSMLMFYRLLFDKYANYTKKHFSVFILTNRSNKSNQDELSDDEEANIEFQLSLKFDPNLNPYVLNNKVSLTYCVKSRVLFENVIFLLHGLTKEIIPDKMYSTYDPDGNQIYLIDSSSSNSNVFVNYLNTACFSNHLSKNADNLQISSISTLSSNLSNSRQKLILANHPLLDSYFSNISPNSNSNSSSVHTPTNSTSSTSNIPNAGSIESYKDSGRCSTISFSNEFIDNSVKSSILTSTGISNSSSLINKLKSESSNSESVGRGVKDLIKKFNIEQLKFNQTKKQIRNKQVEFTAIQNVKTCYPTSLVDYYSFDNLKEMNKNFNKNTYYKQEQRPVSSLGQPFKNFNQFGRNNRPKSCTQFNNNNYLFSDVQGKNFNNKKYPNCFQMNNKHQVNGNYSTNSSSGKY